MYAAVIYEIACLLLLGSGWRAVSIRGETIECVHFQQDIAPSHIACHWRLLLVLLEHGPQDDHLVSISLQSISIGLQSGLSIERDLRFG